VFDYQFVSKQDMTIILSSTGVLISELQLKKACLGSKAT